MSGQTERSPSAVPRDPSGGRKDARKVVLAQLIITVLISLGFGIVSGLTAGPEKAKANALAALAGGLINVVANLFFVFRWYASPIGGDAAGAASLVIQKVLGLFVAEIGKLLITIALLAFSLSVLKLSFPPLFVAFVATLSVFWLALSPRFWKFFGSRS